MMVVLTETEHAALKTMALRLVLGAGGLEAAASVTRVGKTQLALYYDQHRPDCFMPVDVVAALQRAAGADHMTAELARLRGLELVPIDGAADPCELEAASARAAIEGAEAVAACLSHKSPDEVEREAREAAAAFTRMADRAAARQPNSPAAPAVKGEAAPAVRPRPGRGGGGRRPGARP